MNEIIVRNLKKNFHGKVVLDIPSFGLHSGEIVSIVGTNGAGKSTFIKIISGLMLQDAGDVFVFGSKNTSKDIHNNVKLVLESGRGYYEYLTANQNIDYFLHLNKSSRGQVKDELEDLFNKLAFHPYVDVLVS